jgi:hypothetical protein
MTPEQLEEIRKRLAEALRGMRQWAIPGMNWTDEIGQALLAMADSALADTQGVSHE